MVTMFLLSVLQRTKKIDNVYAMHLEYCNRQESVMETEMIKMYCDMINVPLYIRKIDYMKRDEVDRDFYEEETKRVRFNTYRYLSNLHSISGWCLGHHHGDVAENVLMNLSNGRTILDLSVMKTECEMDGVTLYRPFLSHEKTIIYSFAYDYCIPYLKDSTPDWSCRGVLRRKVLPEMKKQWPSIEHTLCQIGKESDEWCETINTFILEPIKKDITFFRETLTINIAMKEHYKKLPYRVWFSLFLWMFHSIGIHMVSRKNVTHFMSMLDHNIKKEHRFVFSNGCMGFFMKGCLRIIYIKK
jgi:tRNA(Ile)-lysidine synthase TilS/MesJ